MIDWLVPGYRDRILANAGSQRSLGIILPGNAVLDRGVPIGAAEVAFAAVDEVEEAFRLRV